MKKIIYYELKVYFSDGGSIEGIVACPVKSFSKQEHINFVLNYARGYMENENYEIEKVIIRRHTQFNKEAQK